jgi:hypothetical protein
VHGRACVVADGPGSQVGLNLSNLTTRRVIVLVLLMLIIIPFFDRSTFADTLTFQVGTLCCCGWLLGGVGPPPPPHPTPPPAPHDVGSLSVLLPVRARFAPARTP